MVENWVWHQRANVLLQPLLPAVEEQHADDGGDIHILQVSWDAHKTSEMQTIFLSKERATLLHLSFIILLLPALCTNTATYLNIMCSIKISGKNSLVVVEEERMALEVPNQVGP